MSVLMNPDCLDGKHRACSGDGWCEETDHAVPCPCECHQPKECYPGCPHPPCVDIRAARPEPPVPLAYLGCCSSIVKLTRTSPGMFAGIETHLAHCQQAVAPFMPKEGK